MSNKNELALSMTKIYFFIYYALLQFLPIQPMPGYKIFYKLRYLAVRKILARCGTGVIVKNREYFGNGARLSVGDRSQLGQNCRLGGGELYW